MLVEKRSMAADGRRPGPGSPRTSASGRFLGRPGRRSSVRTGQRGARLRRRTFLAIALTAVVLLLSALETGPGERERAPTAPKVPAVAVPLPGIRPTTTFGAATGRPGAAAQDWFNLSPTLPSPVPANRTFAALAYDPALNATLMFGGFNHTAFGPVGDTWLFANGSWLNLTPTLSADPSPRWASMMTWDPWNQEMVLFGGRNLSSSIADTWVFNASGWTQLHPTTEPSARQSQFSVFTADPTLRAVYLYGGSCYICNSYNGTIENDSWTFVNGTWTNVTGTVSGVPSILDYGGWDPQTGGIVGYSSTATNCSGTASTVSFNGTSWSVVNATSPPGPVTQGGGLVYDAVDSAMILFGGGYDVGGICGFFAHTWSYSHGAWTNLTGNLTVAPFARCCYSIAYDPTEKLVVLLGGAETSQAYIGDTWTFPAAPLSASLISSTTLVGVSIPVNFTANLTGGTGPFNVTWNFGDGSPDGTTLTVRHSFASAGVYEIHYTARDADGRGTNRSLEVTVAPALVAAVNASALTGEAPLQVNFTAASTGGAGPFQDSWSFGDTTGATGSAVRHVYRVGGNFTVTLTVRDASEQTSQSSVLVHVLSPLSVSVLSTPTPASGDAPLRVNFSAAPVGIDGPFTATWNFGDGSPTIPGLVAAHLYSNVGQFDAEVTVMDAVGRTANASVPVSVVAPLAVAAFATPPAGLAPFSVALAATASGGTGPIGFSWSFADGSPNATGADVNHTYTTPGRYVAEVRTTDAGGGKVVASVPVTVVAPLTASANENRTYATAPESVGFVSTVAGGLGPEAYDWVFGDGASVTTANASHVYTTVGAYAVNFTATDRLGETVHQSLSLDVYAPFRASVSASPSSLVLGATTTFTAVATGGAGSPTFAWSGLPPGCPSSNETSVTCDPTAAGTFTATVSVRDVHGDPASASVVVNVTSPAGSGPGPVGSGSAAVLGWVTVSGLAGLAIGAVAVSLWHRRRGPPVKPPE